MWLLLGRAGGGADGWGVGEVVAAGGGGAVLGRWGERLGGVGAGVPGSVRVVDSAFAEGLEDLAAEGVQADIV